MHNKEKPRPIPRGDPIPKGERENGKREPLSPKGRRLKTTKMGAEKTRDAKKERKAKRRGQKPAHTKTGEPKPNERERGRMKPTHAKEKGRKRRTPERGEGQRSQPPREG